MKGKIKCHNLKNLRVRKRARKQKHNNFTFHCSLPQVYKQISLTLGKTSQPMRSTPREKLIEVSIPKFKIAYNCHFQYVGTWELVNLFFATEIFSYHICYKNMSKYSKSRDRQTIARQNRTIC